MVRNAALGISLLTAIALSSPVDAASYAFDISGSGISGSAVITYIPNPNTGILPRTSPNPVDPIGSYIVTGIMGTFTDATIGIFGAAITGIVARNPGNPTPTNLLAPHSFGYYPILNGRPIPGGGTAPGFSYDGLFYPEGSPQTSTDYPFFGGIFDIYGIIFGIDGGKVVNLWSDGDMGQGVSYGVGVTDGIDVLDYASPVALAAVPEPPSWLLIIAGFGAVGSALRRRANLHDEAGESLCVA